MQVQLPEVITSHFIITDTDTHWNLRCKGCEKEYKVAKPAEGKTINNLVLRNITKHTESHTYPEEELGEELEDTMYGGDRELQLAHERGADTSYDDHGEAVALPVTYDSIVPPPSESGQFPLPSYPHTYQVYDMRGMVTVTNIPTIHVFTEPRVEKLVDGGYMVTLHAANREHAEAVAKGIIEKARAVPKKRLNWKDKLRSRKEST